MMAKAENLYEALSPINKLYQFLEEQLKIPESNRVQAYNLVPEIMNGAITRFLKKYDLLRKQEHKLREIFRDENTELHDHQLIEITNFSRIRDTVFLRSLSPFIDDLLKTPVRETITIKEWIIVAICDVINDFPGTENPDFLNIYNRYILKKVSKKSSLIPPGSEEAQKALPGSGILPNLFIDTEQFHRFSEKDPLIREWNFIEEIIYFFQSYWGLRNTVSSVDEFLLLNRLRWTGDQPEKKKIINGIIISNIYQDVLWNATKHYYNINILSDTGTVYGMRYTLPRSIPGKKSTKINHYRDIYTGSEISLEASAHYRTGNNRNSSITTKFKNNLILECYDYPVTEIS